MSSTTNSKGPLSIIILGTCDTKLHEILYLRSQILSHSEDASITLVDVGRSPASDPAISIPRNKLLTEYGSPNTADLSTLHRSQVMDIMTECATACLQDRYSTTSVHGVVASGGSGGTSLTSAAMRRALPFLIPKLIVSTVASGDTAPFVGETDITLMYSIVDIAGSNSILDAVLDNAAGGIVGMARAYQQRRKPSEPNRQSSSSTTSPTAPQKRKKRLGITMFGVTTPCVDTIRSILPTLPSPYTFEIYVFHATGHGGLAMERLVRSHGLDALIDLTTTEIADYIVGGVMSAGPSRLEAAAKAGIPQVVSLGACDIVNFGPRHTLPREFGDPAAGRRVYEHNSSVTLVRTEEGECRLIGDFVAGKLRECCIRPGVVEAVIPEGGLSALGGKGGVFEDERADEVLFQAVEEGLKGSGVRVFRDPRGINDEGFARGVAERLVRLVESGEDE
ncbi:MAG: hypothetical protein Q9170_000364 [Blastenia crenularia]